MLVGYQNRTVGATLMNADSSRSHSIFTIVIEQAGSGADDGMAMGKLNLVDLAGSERQSKTGATGDRCVSSAGVVQLPRSRMLSLLLHRCRMVQAEGGDQD